MPHDEQTSSRIEHDKAMHLFKETKILLLSTMSSLGSGSISKSRCLHPPTSRFGTIAGSNAKADDGITLHQILRAFELKIVDCFMEMPQFCIKTRFILTDMYGSDFMKKLEVLQMCIPGAIPVK